MVYEKIAKGKVESCSKRERGFLLGIRVTEYCVQHYLNATPYKIGETVEVFSDPNFGIKIVGENRDGK